MLFGLMLLNQALHRDLLADLGGRLLGFPIIATNGSEGFSSFAGLGRLGVGGLAIGGIALDGGHLVFGPGISWLSTCPAWNRPYPILVLRL